VDNFRGLRCSHGILTAMPPLTTLDTRSPFTRARALAAGITDAMLRGPAFRRLFRGVHIRSDVVLWPTVYAEAALLLHPASAFVSHHSAAEAYRLPVPDQHETHISVIDKADRRRRDGIRHHLASPDSDVSVHNGLRVSGPTQLFVEMGRWLNLVDLVVLGDAMVKRRLVSLAALREACDNSQIRGASAAARAAAYVREGVDSPMESRLRMLLVLAGLPEPEIDVRFLRRDGSVMLRLDLAYRDHKVGVEYDGRQHRDDLDQWDRDLDRGDWFEQAGWTVVKVVARGIYRRPDQTIERVRRALAARGADLPRLLSDEWRGYFPVKP
jgi:very-short-patch-repair endonuclease